MALTPAETVGALVEIAGFQPSPEQMRLKASLLVRAAEEGGSPLSTLQSHAAIEAAAGESVPAEWTSNSLFMNWLRDPDEGRAKAELLYQRCMDRALQMVTEVTLSDKDLVALLKVTSELSGRVAKGGPAPRPKTVGSVAIPAATSREELRKQLHEWAISEGYAPPADK
jgi:hypothetical protein